MAGFDELIEHLLHEIAVAGNKGLSADQFENAVKTFYDQKNPPAEVIAPATKQDLLFSAAPLVDKTIVDDALLDSIWDWLSKHPDVSTKDGKVSDIEQNGEQSTAASAAAFRTALAGRRITTTEDRIWHAVTGHGVDHKRVSPMEFELLSIIAAHGPGGILQPYVRKLSGQDKRSVPKRTDALAEKDYIVKDTVIGSGQKTSSLRLKKYGTSRVPDVAPHAEPGSTLGSRPVIYYNAWFDKTINLLRSNNNVVTMKDLRLHLGVPLNTWARKVLIRCVRRVAEGAGCLQRLTATIHDSNGKPLIATNRAERRAKSIQLVRDPTERDRSLWSTSDPHKSVRAEDSSDEEFDVTPEADFDEDVAASDQEGELIEVDDAGQDDTDSTRQYSPPQWTPDIPLTTLVQNTVDSAGQTGLTSAQVVKRLTGPLWRRPLDEILLRMTDVPVQSLPTTQKHLTMVRDTAVLNGLSAYKFRTTENFEKAVEAGDASEEAILSAAKRGKQKANQPELDSWGFAKVPLKELAGRDGRATLAEGRKAALIEPDEPNGLQAEGITPAQLDFSSAEHSTPSLPPSTPKRSVGRPKGKTSRPKQASALPPMKDAMPPPVGQIVLDAVNERQGSSSTTRATDTTMPPSVGGEAEAALLEQSQQQMAMKSSSGANETLAGLKQPDAHDSSAIDLGVAGIQTTAPGGSDSAMPEQAAQVGRPSLPSRTIASTPQSKKPSAGERFNRAYVDQHPNEDFHHRGRGFWVRGLPSIENNGGRKVAVVGPGAAAWKAQFDSAHKQSSTDPPSATKTRKRKGTGTDSAPSVLVGGGGTSAAGRAQSQDTSPRKRRRTQSVLGKSPQNPIPSSEPQPGAPAGATFTMRVERDSIQPAVSVSTLNPRPHRHRQPTSRIDSDQEVREKKPLPAIITVKKREIPPEEYEEFEANARVIAERQVMAEVKAGKKRDWAEAGLTNLDGLLQDIAHEDLPEDRITQVQAEIVAREKPGIYINPPGAKKMKAENFLRRGRPRNALIAVFKTDRMRTLPWFKDDGGPRMAPRPSKLRSSRSGSGARMLSAERVFDGESESEREATPLRRKKLRTESRSDDDVVMIDAPSIHGDSTIVRNAGTIAEARLSRFLGISDPPTRIPPSEHMDAESMPTDTALWNAAADSSMASIEATDANSQDKASMPPAQSMNDTFDSVANLMVTPTEGTAAPLLASDSLNAAGSGSQHDTSGPAARMDTQASSANAGALSDQLLLNKPTAPLSSEMPQKVAKKRGRPSLQQKSNMPNSELAAIAVPKSRVIRPQDLVDREYVDQHPNETFFHRGAGLWARGLPPLDFGTGLRAAVRGPGAEEWKAHAKAHRDAKKAREKSSSLIVKLPVSPAKLESMRSASIPQNAQGRDEPALRGNSTTLQPRTSQMQRSANNAVSAVASPVSVPKNPLLNIVRPYNQSEVAITPTPNEIELNAMPPAALPAQPLASPTQTAKVQETSVRKAVGQTLTEAQTDSAMYMSPGRDVVAPVARRASKTSEDILAQRQRIILDAIRSCGGVFPGNHELWYVCVTAWKRQYNTEPDRDTVETAVKTLLGSKLKRLTFEFKNKKGESLRRYILIEIGLDANNVVVRKMQKRIIDSYPNLYLPPEADIDDDMRVRAGAKYGKTAGEQISTAFSSNAKATVRLTNPASHPTQLDQHTFVESAKLIKRAAGRKRKSSTTLVPPQSRSRKRRFSDSDDDDFVYPKQAAFQTEFQLDSYRHDSSAAIKVRGSRDHTRLSQRIHLKLNKFDTVGASAKKQTRRSRDVQGCFTLDDQARHQRTSAALLMHPEQALHTASGTFGTAGMITLADGPDQRSRRGRTLLSTGVDQSVLDEVDQFLQEAEEEHDASTDESEDEDQDPPASLIVKLKVPSLASVKAPGSIVERQSTVAAAMGTAQKSFAEPYQQTGDTPMTLDDTGLTTEMPPSADGTTVTGRPKRKYKSRLQPATPVEEQLRESDGEFEPEIQILSPRSTKKRNIPDRGVGPKRDRKSTVIFKDTDRLLLAMALVSAVCGGLHPDRCNWTLIAHALSFRYDIDFLRRRWPHIKQTRARDVDKLRSAMHAPFLEAYEKGDLPRIDFQNLNQTDWATLFEWAEANVVPEVVQDDPSIFQLNGSREETEQDVVFEDEGPLFELDHNDYFTAKTHLNRRHLAMRYTNSIPLVSRAHEDDLAVLKSLIRATASTKQRNYDKDAAVQKLAEFSDTDLERGINEMLKSNMLSQERNGRQLPGRNYHLHKEVLSQFNGRWSNNDEHLYLRQVASAYQVINSYFKEHDSLELNPAASDAQYLVLTNMVAHGQLRVKAMLPERNDDFNAPHPKLSAWSYGDKNYEMKKVDLSVLKFPIVYSKTAAYQDYHGLKLSVAIPRADTHGRTPFWVDVHSNVLEDHWDMVLRSVMHLLVFRSGLTAAQMARAHNNKLWTWELEAVMQWMEEVGLAVRCSYGREQDGVWKGGWRAADNWFCAFLPEVATWQAPAGVEIGL